MAESPLSSQSRKSFFAGGDSFSSFFSGRNVNAFNRPDPQTLQAVQTNQESITSLQGQVQVLRTEIFNLSSGLNEIASLIKSDSILEKQRLRTAEENERRLTETQLRMSRENELEKKIQTAVSAPVERIYKNTKSLFDRIMNALKILFVGWLTSSVITLYKAYTEGNKQKFEDIGKNILKNAGFAIAGLFAIRKGIDLVIKSVFGVSAKIAGLVGKIIKAPINAAKGLGSAATNLFKIGSKTSAGAASATTKVAGRAGGGLLMRALPFVGTGIDLWGASSEYSKGNLTGAGLYGAAAVTSLVPGLQIPSLALSGAGLVSSMTYNKDNNSNNKQKPPEKPPITPNKKPTNTNQSPKISPEKSKNESQMMGPSKMDSFENLSSTFRAPSLQNYNISNTFNPINENKLTPDQISMPEKPQTNIAPLQEPTPQVIIASSQPNTPPSMPKTSNNPATNVPLIKSSNPDNFYVLYSQLNYNVVM